MVAAGDGQSGAEVLPGRLVALLDTLNEHPEGLTGPALLENLRRRWPGITEARVRRLIEQAGQAVAERDGLYFAAVPAVGGIRSGERRPGPLRAIALDIEALPRLMAKEPYVERAVWQVGAVPLSADAGWVASRGRRLWWVQMPAVFALEEPAKVAAHVAAAIPPAQAYRELADFCVDADLIVAYNGTEIDFDELDRAFDATAIPRLEAERVDGLYLAYCWWPTESSHRLKELAAAVGVDVTGLAWHDAGDDAEMLARLLVHGARTVTGRWSADLCDLVGSVAARSAAWRLVFEIAGLPWPSTSGTPALDERQVAETVAAELSGRTPKRPALPAPAAAFTIPMTWRDQHGNTDPYLMSAAINPAAARRTAQDQMAAEIRLRLASGPDLVIEAPTGTGKSLAALAVALDWLAGGSERKVVIATHTKALQTQMATDVERLAAADPSFVPFAAVVKGAANRLSLRSLVHMCADLAAANRPGQTPRGLLGDPRFAELIVYLLARLVAIPLGLVGESEAYSVDTADVPAFFDGYSGRRWSWFLSELSQRHAGDYEEPDGLGAYTISVKEEIDACRLVITNHAVVFAHLDDLASAGDRTLLIVDEAHTVESSATEALSARLVYQQVEEASRLLGRWAARSDATPQLRDMAAQLEGVLDPGLIPRTAMVTLDRIAGTVADPSFGRSATLASPFSGDSHSAATRNLLYELGRVARASGGARKALRGWRATTGTAMSSSELDRFFDLDTRLGQVSSAAAIVLGDVDLLLGTTYLSAAPSVNPADGTNNGQTAKEAGGGDGHGGEPIPMDELDTDHGGKAPSEEEAPSPDGEDVDVVSGADNVDVGAGPAPSSTPPPAGNRVVWIDEQQGSRLAEGTRHYRFEVATSPIRLSRDGEWSRFRRLFARTVFTSATLTTAGTWAYLEDRLGLGDCDKVVLAGSFDYSRQARLVCFSDFPSWAEHTEAAMRSVAHQLAGYAREATAAGRTPGAMVLTTATATAAGICEHLAAYTAAAGLNVPLHAAPLRGNRRAVEGFRASGGWLVGTKGLWAGVDVPEPERTRIVWINKLPFAPFADPLIAARRADVAARADAEGHPDPDRAATERYYLPLAAVELRQAVGRLIRSDKHRGVIVISDRKLAGSTSTRRLYRRILLESLDAGLYRPDPLTGEATGGNVMPMTRGWEQIWEFLAADGDIDAARLPALCRPEALDSQTLLTETRAIRDAELDRAEVAAFQAAGTFEAEVLARSAKVAGLLRFSDTPLRLKPEQEQAIAAAARGDDLLALLPTGFGKSYCFQLPALVLPGVTIVVSPLVALMADQALELNRTIGGAVRALVTPLRESSSRAGRQEVAEQLTGAAEHHIKLVYTSPERFAHRQFRDWVRAGIAGGRINRIVFDEAHTLLWGDDFRPSYRRLAVALGDLRAAGGAKLPVSALTATANKAVRESLRSDLFGLPSTPPAAGDPSWFCVVSADPVRPELAVYKLALRRAGPIALSRYIESVYDAVSGSSGHAIFYCLTVREVDALYSHLRDYAGPAEAVRIRRFHGRLPEAEKAALLADFRDAPKAGEEGFAPMVVVATSAFGLGINRGDIRCVFVTSPPTDLAALYQQIGRAGRDSVGRIPGPGDTVNVGIALGSIRGFRTVEFISRDLPARVLERAGREVLACGGLLDARRVAERIIDDEVKAGRLARGEADKEATRDSYQTAVTRALAVLAELDAVVDLGDLPATVHLSPGETPAPTGSDPADRFAAEARAWVEADPERAKRASVIDVHRHLADAGVADPSDPASTWAGLVECHHAGVLDTSAASNRTWLTAVDVRTRDLPAQFTARASARTARIAAELAELRTFYSDNTTCVNQAFCDYFASAPPGTVPAGTCSTPECRCTSCWNAEQTGTPPNLLNALLHPPARLASAADDKRRSARLDADITRLLWDNPFGLGPKTIWMVLRGNDTFFDAKTGKRRPLPARLLYHRLFGSRPAVVYQAVSDSVDRLCAAGTIMADGARWRHAQRVGTVLSAVLSGGTG